ncbi:hypothetical protein C7820_4209 [Paenibacillus sp. VMFN-D1]|nr:hypothetical protein C7820_4209 [Paenibacillus sp. VMFN-D1]
MRRLFSLNKKALKTGLTEKNDNLHLDKLNKYINDIEEDM